ncbi:MAG: uracil-DNA glycosylase [Planctomycetota bacterium]
MAEDQGRLLAALRERLELELAGGLDVLPRGKRPVAAPAPVDAARPAASVRKLPIHPPADTPLGKVCEEALGCTRCKLAKTRTQVVFGVGNPKSILMFVGEAPGGDEDAQGEPFVGRAGQLLTKLLGEAGLTRQEVYIANVLKCRPPGNRPPEADEVAQCTTWLRKQLELIRPKLLCALGNPSLKFFLGADKRIMQARGRFYPTDSFLVFPTLHPSYLLRTPGDTHLVQQDFRNLAEKYREMLKESGAGGRPSQ